MDYCMVPPSHSLPGVGPRILLLSIWYPSLLSNLHLVPLSPWIVLQAINSDFTPYPLAFLLGDASVLGRGRLARLLSSLSFLAASSTYACIILHKGLSPPPPSFTQENSLWLSNNSPGASAQTNGFGLRWAAGRHPIAGLASVIHTLIVSSCRRAYSLIAVFCGAGIVYSDQG